LPNHVKERLAYSCWKASVCLDFLRKSNHPRCGDKLRQYQKQCKTKYWALSLGLTSLEIERLTRIKESGSTKTNQKLYVWLLTNHSKFKDCVFPRYQSRSWEIQISCLNGRLLLFWAQVYETHWSNQWLLQSPHPPVIWAKVNHQVLFLLLNLSIFHQTALGFCLSVFIVDDLALLCQKFVLKVRRQGNCFYEKSLLWQG